MKVILFFFLLLSFLFSKSYNSKIEPFESFYISSQTNGVLIKVLKDKELKKTDGLVLEIDNSLETKKLKNLKEKLKILNEPNIL